MSIHQAVTLHLEPDAEPANAFNATLRRRPAQPRGGSVLDPDIVSIGNAIVGIVPAIGTSLAPGREQLDGAELGALRGLHPATVRVVLELDRPSWDSALAHAANVAWTIDSSLEIEAVAGDDGAGLDALVDALATVEQAVANAFIYPTTGYVTTRAVATRIRETLAKEGVALPIGGGSRANFAELNRADLPMDLLDMVGFAINPQVHAFDETSILETVDAQAVARGSSASSAGSSSRKAARHLGSGTTTGIPRDVHGSVGGGDGTTAERAPGEPGSGPRRRDPHQPA